MQAPTHCNLKMTWDEKVVLSREAGQFRSVFLRIEFRMSGDLIQTYKFPRKLDRLDGEMFLLKGVRN